ncbi:MAG: hypothetical protein IPM89_12235 [Candidatus Competibacteraceae bacterium]|nr:MAG: hypothetical protein IPM89_12235 [Candidatus Competibacteraceae bacterium]
MKLFRICSTALVLLLGTVIAYAQGFQNESFTPGAGKPELQYHILVPEGITITNKQGEVFKAGQIIMVPGANVTILESAYVKEHMQDPAFQSSFVNEKQFVGMPEEKVQDYAIVSVKVREGVTIEGFGKTIEGPSSVTLIAKKAEMEAMPDSTPAESWDTMGGLGGWNK